MVRQLSSHGRIDELAPEWLRQCRREAISRSRKHLRYGGRASASFISNSALAMTALVAIKAEINKIVTAVHHTYKVEYIFPGHRTG
jgi:hypothetical protein